MVEGVSKETNHMVQNSNVLGDEMLHQVEIINTVIEGYGHMTAVIQEMIQKIESITQTANYINGSKNEMIIKISNATAVAEEISASIQEVAASTGEARREANLVKESGKKMSILAQNMNDEMTKFKI